MSTTSDEGTRGAYAFNSASEQGQEQLGYLARLLDRQTTSVLAATGVGPGWHCLELGAGSGSIAGWLARQTRPAGSVLAVDLDVDSIDTESEVRVRRHNLNEGVPPGEPFDLIHARLLLMHLRRRVEILRELVDALAPGGYLVIGEFVGPQEHVLSTPSQADAELFHRVQHIAHNVIGRGAGVSYEWPRQVARHMTETGLTNVEVAEFSHMSTGGGVGCALNSNYVRQLDAPSRAAGLSADELSRYHALMGDPRFRVWFYPYVCTTGQKPAA